MPYIKRCFARLRDQKLRIKAVDVQTDITKHIRNNKKSADFGSSIIIIFISSMIRTK
ncbi:MAG: hypothetical protein K6E62_14385 [Lachnospiraceae bacterium]|nr:hypothetical protein [Lachnospiraceae bacterium]